MRKFKKLRLSLTTACNYACVFCVDKRDLTAKKQLLSQDQLQQLLLTFKNQGITHVRLTGGEPTIAPMLSETIQVLKQVQFEHLAITSNGFKLQKYLPELIDCGLSRVSLSISGLESYAKITRYGSLDSILPVLKDITESRLKCHLNYVPVRGINDHEIVDFFKFAQKYGVQPRYIELMQIGYLHGNKSFTEQLVKKAEILEHLSSIGEIKHLGRDASATTERYELDGYEFGIICNTSKPFCSDCDRLRIDTDGLMYGCLSNSNGIDLKPVLQNDQKDQLDNKIKMLLAEAMKMKSANRFLGTTTPMKWIGG